MVVPSVLINFLESKTQYYLLFVLCKWSRENIKMQIIKYDFEINLNEKSLLICRQRGTDKRLKLLFQNLFDQRKGYICRPSMESVFKNESICHMHVEISCMILPLR